jgi:hypothetical protein
MGTNVELNAAEAALAFQCPGRLVSVTQHGDGHINDSFCATFQNGHGPRRYLLQHINTSIFRDPSALMRNIERVTAHLAAKSADHPDRQRRVLSLVSSNDGGALHQDRDGQYWRMYHFIDGASTISQVRSPRQAYEAARAFGQFQAQLADLPTPPLAETIPNFHHTPSRFAALEQAIAANPLGRVAGAAHEIDFALTHRSMIRTLFDAGLPVRTTHNDTKINNVLLDDATGEGICIVDLDTVMPGFSVYDFGDLARTSLCAAAEDERNLSKVEMDFSLFEALVRGFLSSTGGFLTAAERRSLPFSCKLITFNIGIRFLTDHLQGDTYFRIHRESQNLDRARTQFQLIRSIEQNEERMLRLVESL